jgi:hypothetical protein
MAVSLDVGEVSSQLMDWQQQQHQQQVAYLMGAVYERVKGQTMEALSKLASVQQLWPSVT